MLDTTRTLDRIERALDTDPFCPVCDAPTVIRQRGGHLWLECSTTAEVAPDGLVARIGAVVTRHPSRIVADLTELVAA